jgi:hypothetical protein
MITKLVVPAAAAARGLLDVDCPAAGAIPGMPPPTHADKNRDKASKIKSWYKRKCDIRFTNNSYSMK